MIVKLRVIFSSAPAPCRQILSTAPDSEVPLADVVGAVVAGPQQRGNGRVAGLQTAQVTWRVDSV